MLNFSRFLFITFLRGAAAPLAMRIQLAACAPLARHIGARFAAPRDRREKIFVQQSLYGTPVVAVSRFLDRRVRAKILLAVRSHAIYDS